MGPMDMDIDQFVAAPPSQEPENQYHGYYLNGAGEQNLGAPPQPEIDNDQQYQGYQYGFDQQNQQMLGSPHGYHRYGFDQQMVGGPLEDLLHVIFT